MFRAIWRRSWARKTPSLEVVHLHKTSFHNPWVRRTLGKCGTTLACTCFFLYLFQRKLDEVDFESLQQDDDDDHFTGWFLPLPRFEVLPPTKGFPRNGPVWDRYKRFVEDESRRQAANAFPTRAETEDIMDKVSSAYKAPGAPWVKKFGPPLSVNAHLTIILPGGPNPEPYQLGMVILDDNDGPLFRKRLVTRSYWRRVERVFNPKAFFMASWAFTSCLWNTTVVEVKQAMGVETDPATTAAAQRWSLRNLPIWSRDPPKHTPINILGQLPIGLHTSYGPKPVGSQSALPGARTDNGPGKPSATPTPLPLLISDVNSPPGGKNSQSLTKDAGKDNQQPRTGWTDEQGNPLVPMWLDYMANPQTHEPFMKRLENISKAPRAAFMQELSKHPAWRPHSIYDYPPEGAIRLVGPVVVTTPVAYIHLDVSYWYDPATKKVIDQGAEISLKAVGHRWDAKKTPEVKAKATADKWNPERNAEKNAQPREPPEHKE